MKNRFILSIINLFLLASFSLANGQGDALPPNAQAEKCYAKCLVQASEIFYKEKTYPVYIGSDPKVKLDVVKVIHKLEDYSWERQWKPCNNEPSDSCLIWCAITTPGESKTILVPRRPKKLSKEDIEYQTFTVAYRKGSQEKTEWQEVICANKLNSKFILRLKSSLNRAGFDVPLNGGTILDEITKDALFLYQRQNNLPLGGLNLETLDHLGVEY